MNRRDAAIGVLGSEMPERSGMDQRMQVEFNRENKELYMSSGIGIVGPGDRGRRSEMDVKMQQEFNPYYKPVETYNRKTRRTVRENYCDMNCRCGCAQGQACNCPFARITDNPNNPMSANVIYLPLK